MFRSARALIREYLLRWFYPRGWFGIKSTRIAPLGPQPALVLMCLWNRSSRFAEILDDLAKQDFPDGVIVGFWNNNRGLRSHYESTLSEWLRAHKPGALRQVHFVHSPVNAGGMGRFYLARSLAKIYRQPFAIFLDDDQRVQASFIRLVQAQAAPRTIASWWAWIVTNGNYWERIRALPGQRVSYAGTGGMIVDCNVLKIPALYKDLPRKYWFLEDMWLNHVALTHGYHLVALDAEIEFVMDETNQFHSLAALKPEFYRKLTEQAKVNRSL